MKNEEESGFWGPEGQYVEWVGDSGYYKHKFTKKELSELSPVPSRLVATTYPNKKVVVVASLRKEVCWHVDHSPAPQGKLTYDETQMEHATCVALSGSEIVEPQILIGFTSGEIVLHNTMQEKTDWFNFDCEVCDSPVTAISWITRTSFIVGHLNGDMYEHNTTFSTTVRLKKDGKTFGDVVITKCKKPNINPTKRWSLGKPAAAVMALATSPVEANTIACGDKSGKLTIINVMTDAVVARVQLQSFGTMHAVTWSPDGKYIACGGQDDLITIYSVESHTTVVVGIGHSSWLMAIQFDTFATSCARGCYRLITVGQDGKLFLWELNPANLPKQEVALKNKPIKSKTKPALTPPTLLENEGLTIVGQATLHDDPITDVISLSNCIATVCTAGFIKLWARPVSRIESAV
eukprot:m.26786 g.26786  ORF g.26786 m.26786 type:complete len:407 (-) comp15542_c0_seq1:378-1598(-)